MDHDDVANLTNSSFNGDIAPARSAALIAHDVIFIIFSLVGVCADAAIIYILLSFKRMRTIPNIFLVNWAICDLCLLLVTPSSYIVISVLDNITMHPHFVCGLHHLGSVLFYMLVLFVILASVDWLMAVYFPKASNTFRNYNRFIIGTVWISSLLCCAITIGLCYANKVVQLPIAMLHYSLWVVFIGTIILQSSRALGKYGLKVPVGYPTLMLTLTTALVACWSLGFIVSLATGFFIDHPLIDALVECLVFSNSIVNFTILYFLSKDFQACVNETLRRSGRRYEDFSSVSENTVSGDVSLVL